MHRNHRLVPGLGAAIVAVGLATAPAPAGHTEASTSTVLTGSAHPDVIGCLTIGSGQYDVYDSGNCCDAIADAFGRAGYSAHRRGLSVYVRIGRHAPTVRWTGTKHRVSVSRRGSYLVLRPFRVHAPRIRRLPYYGRHPSWRYRRPIGCSNVRVFRSLRSRYR